MTITERTETHVVILPNDALQRSTFMRAEVGPNGATVRLISGNSFTVTLDNAAQAQALEDLFRVIKAKLQSAA